jgi:hypothetical protein
VTKEAQKVRVKIISQPQFEYLEIVEQIKDIGRLIRKVKPNGGHA